MYDFKKDLTDYNKTVEPISTETPKYDFQADLKAFQDFQPINPLEGVNNDLAIKAYREQKKKQDQQMKEMSKTADLMMESGNNPTPESVSSAQMTEGAKKSLAGMQDKILGKAGVITQRFGNRNPIETFSGGVNYGTDIGVPRGTKVSVPPGKWKVIEAFAGAKEGPKAINRGYGNSILVQNEQTGEKMRFSHLSDVGVRPGETIDGNKIVGTSGSTGNSTGPHLDLEMYDRSGRLIDILNTPYSSYLGLGQGGGSTKGEGGGNPLDTITQVGRDVIGAVGNTPILPFIPQITPNRMASYKAPFEDQTQNIPQSVRNAFPITQIPEQIGSAVRQIGRFASLKPDAMDIATAPLMFMGGVKAKEIPTSALKKISTTDRQIMGDFVTAIENGEAKKVLGNLGKDAENIAKALGIPETSTNKTIAKHFNDIIEAMDKKGIKPLLDKELPIKPSTGGEMDWSKREFPVSVQKLKEEILLNSDSNVNASALEAKLKEGGNSYIKTKIDPNTLKIQDADLLKPQSTLNEGYKPIVVGKDGFVIDGRNRALAAKKQGVMIDAYVSSTGGEITGKKGIVQAGNTYADLHGVDPEQTITVYRGVKSSQNGKLTGGEWVTQDKELANLYSRNRARASGEDAKIISQKVKAKDLIIDPSTNPGVDNEFRFNPSSGEIPKGVKK